MATTYSSITIWSRVSTALRVFVISIATAVTDFVRYIARTAVAWVRTAAGRKYLTLAERLPLARLSARETFHLRTVKRARPMVTPHWRMCASV